jgi:hypothetical protein
MFRLGMRAYAIRRNNDLPFVNGGISASMKSVHPKKIFPLIVYACTVFIVYLGAFSKPVTDLLRFAYSPIPKRFERTPIGTLF